MSCFGKVAYWNERYSFKNERYEWFQSYDGFRHLLTPEMLSPADGVSTSKPRRTIEVRDRDGNMVPRSIVCPDETPRLSPTKFPSPNECRVLILGCGNSRVGEAMMNDGWTGGIVNVDFSEVVIEQMKERYDETFYNKVEKSYKNAMGSPSTNVEPMEFVCADVTTELPFEDGSFDLVVCKGTLDAILCSPGSVANAKRMMHECCRLLADEHGALVVVTHANAENRLVFFENDGDEWWAGLNVHRISNERSALNDFESRGGETYVYTCRKNPGGGKATRPVPCMTVKETIKPLIRSSSNEENEETISTMADLKVSPPRSKETSPLVQVQVPVVNC